MIQINPLQNYIDGGPRAAITTPPSASLVFDLPGKATWVKGVKFKGTDHTYTFSHDNYINLANTPGSDESEDIKIGININTLKADIDTTYTTGTLTLLQTGTDTSALVWAAKVLALFVNGVLPSTKDITINGTTYAIYTSASSLPTFIAPTQLGAAGLVLSCNTNGLTWINLISNSDYLVTLGKVTSNNDYRILLKKTADDNSETTFVNFAETLTYNPSTKLLKINGNRVITITDVFTGATSSADGTAGLVKQPLIADRNKFLKGDGTWAIINSDINSWAIEVNKASFSITQLWADSGVDLSSLSQGVCLLHINYQNVHYSGIFTYYGQSINTDDEIVLHQSGTVSLDRGRIFAKIAPISGTTKLLLAGATPETNISLFNIKIKQIAIL